MVGESRITGTCNKSAIVFYASLKTLVIRSAGCSSIPWRVRFRESRGTIPIAPLMFTLRSRGPQRQLRLGVTLCTRELTLSHHLIWCSKTVLCITLSCWLWNLIWTISRFARSGIKQWNVHSSKAGGMLLGYIWMGNQSKRRDTCLFWRKN